MCIRDRETIQELLSPQISTSKTPKKASASAKSSLHKEKSGLNEAFNFNNYVTGRANQLARAAAIQVAEMCIRDRFYCVPKFWQFLAASALKSIFLLQ